MRYHHGNSVQSIRQDFETERPNLLFFEKWGVQILNVQYFCTCTCITQETGCPFSKQGVSLPPKGIAGQYHDSVSATVSLLLVKIIVYCLFTGLWYV